MSDPASAADIGRERRLLALAFCSQASVSIASWGLGALGPELRAELGLSAAGLGALLAASFVGNALVLVPAGALIDRVGPRGPLIIGGAGAGLALIAAALIPGLAAVAVGLFAFGVAGGFVALAGTVSIVHAIDARRRGAALGVRQMAVAAGGLIAAGLLPWLAVLGGVRLALAVSGLLAACFAILFGLRSPRGRRHAEVAPRRGDLRRMLRLPGMLRLGLIALVFVTCLTAVLNFAVPAIRAEGASVGVGQALFAIVSVGAMLARYGWGRRADARGGRRRRATLRDIGVVTVVGALVYWAAGAIGPTAQLPAMLLFAIGAMGANGIIYLMASELAGPRWAGQAAGLMATILFGGSAAASVALGLLADAVGFSALWPACACLGIIAVALVAGVPEPSRAPPAPAPTAPTP